MTALKPGEGNSGGTKAAETRTDKPLRKNSHNNSKPRISLKRKTGLNKVK